MVYKNNYYKSYVHPLVRFHSATDCSGDQQ